MNSNKAGITHRMRETTFSGSIASFQSQLLGRIQAARLSRIEAKISRLADVLISKPDISQDEVDSLLRGLKNLYTRRDRVNGSIKGRGNG